MGHARGGARPRPDDAAVLRVRRAGRGAAGRTVSSTTSSTWRRARGSRTSSSRRSTRRSSSPARSSASRTSTATIRREAEIRSLADRLYRAADWYVGADSAAPRLDGLDAGGRAVSDWDWRGLQRGDDPLRPRARLADPSGRSGGVGPSTRARTSGATSTGRSTCSSRRSSGISTRTSGSTSAGSATRYMRGKGIDYFENSRRATYAHRAYAIANPGGWRDYGPNVWGLIGVRRSRRRRLRDRRPKAPLLHLCGARRLRGRDPRRRDDRADGGRELACRSRPRSSCRRSPRCGPRTGEPPLRRYGFLDAFNPTFRLDGPRPPRPRRRRRSGLVRHGLPRASTRGRSSR